MKIAVVGHTGRVGQELQSLIFDSKHYLSAGWDSQGPCMFKINSKDQLNKTNSDINKSPIKLQQGWNANDIDIVIDFSLPENFPALLKWCRDNKKPLVSGVTGLGEITELALEKIMGKDFELTAPVFWSSNMSLGIALVKQFIEMAKFFSPNEFQISETHHIHKKDSPSGTAISLAHKIKKSFNLDEEIPIVAFRHEEVFGIHEITFKSDEEIIRIYHEAINRRVFASGAIKVSEWLFARTDSARLYFMEDFIQDVKNS